MLYPRLFISLFCLIFPIFFIGCTDPAMEELSQQGLLQDVPSAQEIRDSYQDQKDEKKTKAQVPSSSTSGIDIPYLKGKSIEQVKGILTQQLGPLQEVLPLGPPCGKKKGCVGAPEATEPPICRPMQKRSMVRRRL